GLHERRYHLSVDPVTDLAVAAQCEHVLEARALGDGDRRREVVAVAVLVADVLDVAGVPRSVPAATGNADVPGGGIPAVGLVRCICPLSTRPTNLLVLRAARIHRYTWACLLHELPVWRLAGAAPGRHRTA